jgi:hypothetical protein
MTPRSRGSPGGFSGHGPVRATAGRGTRNRPTGWPPAWSAWPWHLEASDALAVLHSYAYAADRTVDALVADVVWGRLTAEELGEDAVSDH